jgi:hypothetical protein
VACLAHPVTDNFLKIVCLWQGKVPYDFLLTLAPVEACRDLLEVVED